MANSRPNLGGLFNGSTPPERSSSIAAALGSASSADHEQPPDRQSSAAGRGRRTASSARSSAPPLGAPVPPIGAAPTGIPGARGTADQWAALQWLDPVRVLGFYFDVVQVAFDVQRRLTMGVATIVTAPVRRAGVWR